MGGTIFFRCGFSYFLHTILDQDFTINSNCENTYSNRSCHAVVVEVEEVKVEEVEVEVDNVGTKERRHFDLTKAKMRM